MTKGDLHSAEFFIENSLLFSRSVDDTLKGLLYSNISCFFELKADHKKSRLYHSHSMLVQEQTKSVVARVVNLNNVTVIELNAKNYEAAFDSAKQAVQLMEPLFLAEVPKQSNAAI